MTAKISRLLLILLTVFVASIYLPYLYQRSLKRNVTYRSLNYSELTNDFLIVGSMKDSIYDTKGNAYDMAGYENLIPCMSFRQLMKNGTMPDSLNGAAMTLEALYNSSYSMRMQLNETSKYFGLVPLLEGGTENVGYVSKGDLMRINKNGVEFIDTETNTVNKEKSAMFDAALKTIGYVPPAKKIWGSISTSKMVDEGTLFTDQNDALFKVKYFAGQPVVSNISLPEGMIIRRIYYSPRGSVLGYIFDDKNQIFLLDKNGSISKLPINNFDYNNDRAIEFWGNMFYNFITISAEVGQTLTVMDKKNDLIDSYTLKVEQYKDTPAGKFEPFLYPFKVSQYTFVQGYDFDVICFGWWKFIFLNVVFAALTLYLKKRADLNLCSPFNVVDVCLVAVFGIFAFIGVMIFPIRK